MIYLQELFERAQEILDARRADAEAAREAKDRAFEAEEPEYRRWKLKRIRSAASIIRALDMKTKEEAAAYLAGLKDENLRAQEEIKRLLRAHGYPEDHLETQYFCKKCGDVGSVGTRVCDCMIDVLRDLAFKEAGERSPLRFSSFEDFSLDYYPDEVSKQYGCSSRERMRQIFSLCREYAENFDTRSENLLMVGPTGLGKTHLSLAIAGEVIKKGYNVIYNSAQNLLSDLQKEYFGKAEERGQYEAMVLECDLLVIDDLGVEFATQFTRAELYNVINTRLNARRPTIISTNLSLLELEHAYSSRISSRLIGDFLKLEFFGADVRQIKNRI